MTTKPVGKKRVWDYCIEKHQGKWNCISVLEKGMGFAIAIPLIQELTERASK